MSTTVVFFPLGQVVATPASLALLERLGVRPAILIARHQSGDYGDLDDEDQQANALALVDGDRILSAYQINASDKVWIITEADRSVTTILLPEEY